jgi:CRISPR-associated protein Cst1
MTKNSIALYPSNWLYNAGVVGLLKVLEYNEIGFEINEQVIINKASIKASYKGIFKYHKEVLKEKKFSIWGKNKRYPNYIQSSQKEFFENHYIEALQSVEKSKNKTCSWCEGYFISQNLIDNIKSKFKGNFSSFIEQREKFQGIHFAGLGAAITEVPNSFWNLNFSIPICHLCSYLIIFNHLAFIKTPEGEIFINAPDFKLIWELNRFAENLLQKSKEYEIRKILGSSLLQWAIKRRTLLGAWTMMNIEVIVKKRIVNPNTKKVETIIDYFDLPQNITKILLDYEIASLIEEINEEKIFDLILQGKFSELEKANYFVLRTILKLKNKEKNKEEISKNDPITKYFTKYQDFNYLKKVSEILPELYIKILEKKLGGEYGRKKRKC